MFPVRPHVSMALVGWLMLEAARGREPGPPRPKRLNKKVRALENEDAEFEHMATLADTCHVCVLYGLDAPSMYINPKQDGLGATWQSIFTAMAVANKCGMNFGGMLNGQHVAHGIDVTAAATRLFGIDDSSFFFTTTTPTFDDNHTYSTIADLPCPLEGFDRDPSSCRQNILLDTSIPQLEAGRAGPEYYFTPSFVAAMRSQVKPGLEARLAKLNVFQAGRTSVAIPMRRGEITPEHLAAGRYTENEWYYPIIGKIREMVPDADIHLWSQGRKDQFDGFKEHGVKLHISRNDEELDAWAHFMSADIFLAAMSAFSWVPAILNPNCVVYESLPLPQKAWVKVGNLGADSPNFQHDLQNCLAKLNIQHPDGSVASESGDSKDNHTTAENGQRIEEGFHKTFRQASDDSVFQRSDGSALSESDDSKDNHMTAENGQRIEEGFHKTVRQVSDYSVFQRSDGSALSESDDSKDNHTTADDGQRIDPAYPYVSRSSFLASL